MKILIVGDDTAAAECQQKFGDNHEYFPIDRMDLDNAEDADIIFDFTIDEAAEEFEVYQDQKAVVFLNTVKISIAELCFMIDGKMNCRVFGFNGLPSLLNRSTLEVSLRKESDRPVLENICAQLNTDYVIVDDRVGMVTPRVICMIINEAYYTVQEKTATREDIDVAMKLGTNYPYGPFEWSKKIGLRHVFETLEAVYDDTKDERYKICPLLKKEYLQMGR